MAMYDQARYFTGMSASAPEVTMIKTTESQYYALLMIYTAVIFVFNWGTRLLILEPLARRLLNINEKQQVKNDKKQLEVLRERLEEDPSSARLKASVSRLQAKVNLKPHQRAAEVKEQACIKWAQAGIDGLYYSVSTVLGLMIVPGQPFSWPSSLWWQGFHTGAHVVIQRDMAFYYITYAARYLQGSVSCFLEPKRSDFIQMQVHHIVTVLLVTLSYQYGWVRVGVAVMLLLDPADVFLHLGKQAQYLADYNSPRYTPLADGSLYIFAVLFGVMRIFMYPYICWSACWESQEIWRAEHDKSYQHGVSEWAAVSMLWILMGLQCFWFYLICAKAYGIIVRGEEANDDRSDDE